MELRSVGNTRPTLLQRRQCDAMREWDGMGRMGSSQ